MPLTAGTRLGVYEVTAPLGEGGMGEVYRATDTTLGRQVAIKILPDAFAADPDRLTRFEREAKTLASLNHPHIAAIYGFEKSGGLHALVMELIEGDDLSEKIAGLRAQGSGLPIDEALPIARQIAEALEAAHEQGIVHRDLKPANIKVRADGTVKVLDFGLAKATEAGGAGGAGNLSMSPTITTPAMTLAGVILGTAAYMAPEQARGRSVDKRADIWAFGAVLFEMLTTRRAFPGEDITDTIVSIVSKEPDWSTLPVATPAGLRRLLARCLKKDPKTRMRDIGEARLQIEELISGAPEETAGAVVVQPAVPAPRRMRVIPMVVTAAVASAFVGAGVWTFKPVPAPARPVTRFTIPLGEGQTFSTNNSQSLALSPDGTALVYVANFQLYLRSMSDREARPIAGTEGRPSPTTPVFAPDGRSIAFYSQQERVFQKVAVSGGAAVTICQSETVRGMSWDASGIIFADASGRIKRVPADGGQPETLLSVKDNEVVYGPALLPGGEWMLFTIAPADNVETWDKAQIVVQSLKTSERRTLVTGGSDGRYLPTGHIVYALGGVLLAVPFDRQRMTVAGGPVAVVEGVQRGSAGLVARFNVSGTGSLAFVPGPVAASAAHTDLALIDRAGASELLKLPLNRYEYPRLSPDGKRIAVGGADGKDAVVLIYDLSGASSIRRLTLNGRNRVPVWAADGERVAFQSDREGDLAIWRQRADGTAPAERLTKPEKDTAHVPESWSPDGKTLLFSVAAGQRFTLAALSLPDSKVTPVGGTQSEIPPAAAFSPDGKWVAYSVNNGGTAIQNGLFVQPFPATGAIYPIAKNGIHPTWAPDGKTLYYVPGPSRIAEVSITTRPAFTFGNPTFSPLRFVDRGPRFERSVDITPDGKRFLGLFSPGDDTALGPTAPRQIQVVLNWAEELKARVPAK